MRSTAKIGTMIMDFTEARVSPHNIHLARTLIFGENNDIPVSGLLNNCYNTDSSYCITLSLGLLRLRPIFINTHIQLLQKVDNSITVLS